MIPPNPDFRRIQLPAFSQQSICPDDGSSTFLRDAEKSKGKGKGIIHPRTQHEVPEGGIGVSLFFP